MPLVWAVEQFQRLRKSNCNIYNRILGFLIQSIKASTNKAGVWVEPLTVKSSSLLYICSFSMKRITRYLNRAAVLRDKEGWLYGASQVQDSLLR